MIIVSQDKKETINYDKITEIVVSGKNICIIDDVYEENGETIGTYKTEERAKEILGAITAAYQASEIYKYSDIGIRNEMANIYNKLGTTPFKYEMPEE